MPKKYTVLVVDDDECRDFVTWILEHEFGDETLNIVATTSGNKAIDILKSKIQVDCVITDQNMPDGLGSDIVHFLKDQKIDIPVLLVTTVLPEELSESDIYAHIEKPHIREPLIENLSELIKAAVVRTPKPTDDFRRININRLLNSDEIILDLYQRSGAGTFSVILGKGHHFDWFEYEKLKKKNLNYLYYKKDEGLSFIEEFQDQLHRISLTRDASAEQLLKASQDAHETMQYFGKSLGWGDEVFQIAHASAEIAIQVVKKNPKLSDLLGKILVDPAHYLASHSTSVAYVSCGICSQTEYGNDDNYEKLTVAAMFHDLTLSSRSLGSLKTLDELVSDPNSADMPEVKKYLKHPVKSAELLAEYPNFTKEIQTIVKQHHEKPDGSGFPLGLNSDEIDSLAAILIVAEDLVDFCYGVTDRRSHLVEDFIEKRKTLYAHAPFDQFLKAIQ